MEIEDRAKRSDSNLIRPKEKQVQRRYIKVRNHGLVVIGVRTLVPIGSTTLNQHINFRHGLAWSLSLGANSGDGLCVD